MLDFGAIANGTHQCDEPFQNALRAAGALKGGRGTDLHICVIYRVDTDTACVNYSIIIVVVAIVTFFSYQFIGLL